MLLTKIEKSGCTAAVSNLGKDTCQEWESNTYCSLTSRGGVLQPTTQSGKGLIPLEAMQN